MAVIHRTTLTPNKLELLATWLPAQPWYLGNGTDGPELEKAGGFRLDDPAGEVGIEFMAVRDEAGDGPPVTYLAPMTYRGAPLAGVADAALIGTTEHGVLGRRWVYDGAHDRVLVAQLFALVLGEAEPQAQSLTDTPDPTVAGYFAEKAAEYAAGVNSGVTDGPTGTAVLVRAETPGGERELAFHLNRVLRPGEDEAHEADEAVLGHVTANWLLADGGSARGRYAVVNEAGRAG